MVGRWFYSFPYPWDVLVPSMIWLVLCTTFCIYLRHVSLRLNPRARKLTIAAPLVGFLVDLSHWWLCFFLYNMRVLNPIEPTGVSWWLIDGPIVKSLDDIANGVMWHLFRVCGPYSAISFHNGSSSWHAAVSVIFITVFNKSAFVGALVSTALVLGFWLRKRMHPKEE
jgi:hypothetical protein